MVRCRAKGENYSYDFAASLQNTNEQSILISEKDLTAWKGAAERMLTNEIVLKVFSDYLNRDTDFEVVLTSSIELGIIHQQTESSLIAIQLLSKLLCIFQGSIHLVQCPLYI